MGIQKLHTFSLANHFDAMHGVRVCRVGRLPGHFVRTPAISQGIVNRIAEEIVVVIVSAAGKAGKLGNSSPHGFLFEFAPWRWQVQAIERAEARRRPRSSHTLFKTVD